MENLDKLVLSPPSHTQTSLVFLGRLNTDPPEVEYYVKYPDPLVPSEAAVSHIRLEQEDEVRQVYHIGPILRKKTSRTHVSPLAGLYATDLCMAATDDVPRQYLLLPQTYRQSPRRRVQLPDDRAVFTFAYQRNDQPGIFSITRGWNDVELVRLASLKDIGAADIESSGTATVFMQTSTSASPQPRDRASTATTSESEETTTSISNSLGGILDRTELTHASQEAQIRKALRFDNFTCKIQEVKFEVHPLQSGVGTYLAASEIPGHDHKLHKQRQQMNIDGKRRAEGGTIPSDFLQKVWDEVVLPGGYVLVFQPIGPASVAEKTVLVPFGTMTPSCDIDNASTWLLAKNVTLDEYWMVFDYTDSKVADPDGDPPIPTSRIGEIDQKPASFARLTIENGEARCTILGDRGFFLGVAKRRDGKLCVE